MQKKFVDLHVHLDGTLNLKWQYERALKIKAIPSETSFTDYYRMMHPNCSADENMFNKFDLPLDVMQDEEGIKESIYEFCKEQSGLGVIYTEFRFGPQLLTRKGLSQEETLVAAIAGVKEAENDFPIKARIINCLMHKGNGASFNHRENLETIEVTRKHLGKYVVALDLAGYENNCDYDDYAYLFEKIRKYEIPFTMHAGEMGNGENILKAIKMGTKRIGHGINAIQSEEYVKAILENDITLEICPTSNRSFGFNYADHPIHKLYEKGIRICINTDDGTFDNNNLPYEFAMLKNVGFSDKQLLEFTYNGIEAAFCSAEEKKELKKMVDMEK